jgi:hypothetical protein
MIRLPLDCPDDAILAAADAWTDRLAAGDYAGALAMLCDEVGKPRITSADALRACVAECGCETADGGAPRVTPTATAAGERWLYLPSLTRTHLPPDRPGPRGRLDWQLPLNGEWSDLIASFDLEERSGEIVFVLAALRVP